MVEPIKPSDIAEQKKLHIPDVVIETFNEMIVENIDNYGRAVIKQKDVVAKLVSEGLVEKDIFDKHYLNIESIFSEAGWKVTYSKPGFNESGEASFTFARRRI